MQNFSQKKALGTFPIFFLNFVNHIKGTVNLYCLNKKNFYLSTSQDKDFEELVNSKDKVEIVCKARNLMQRADLNMALSIMEFLASKNVRDMDFLEEMSNYFLRCIKF